MTHPSELIALSPCPFCGGKAKLTTVRRGNYRREGDNYQGLCNKCRARGPLVQDDYQLAADKWNFIYPRVLATLPPEHIESEYGLFAKGWNECLKATRVVMRSIFL